jgi:Prp8 binding protein
MRRRLNLQLSSVGNATQHCLTRALHALSADHSFHFRLPRSLPAMSAANPAKRKLADEELQGTVVQHEQPDQQLVLKKQRTGESNQSLVAVHPHSTALVTAASSAPPRTSSLQAPTMCLTGHGAAVLACKFNADGTQLASGGVDKFLLLWDLAKSGEVTNTAMLAGHDDPILDLAWIGTEQVVTASADKTCALWDVQTGQRVKRFRGAQGVVNSVDCSRRGNTLIVTGSDDCTTRIYDLRSKYAAHSFVDHYQILSTVFSDDATQVFSAGISNDIKAWDLRTGKILFDLIGHRDSVTGLSVSPDGSYLLSNSMDCTLRCWDVRPFVPASRLTTVMKGHTHDLEQNLLRCAWSADGLRVAAGSADKATNIWQASSGELTYRLPGHNGVVNAVEFHPTEPVIASCSNDKTIWLGEITASS